MDYLKKNKLLVIGVAVIAVAVVLNLLNIL